MAWVRAISLRFNGAALTGARMDHVQHLHDVVTSGFNGAALTGARMEELRELTPDIYVKLQRGRAHGGADGRTRTRSRSRSISFNGAALTGARMVAPAARPLPGLFRFNGAALTGARMVTTKNTKNKRSKLLQRGRAHGGADGPTSATMTNTAVIASTGPRSRGRGWGVMVTQSG